MNGTTARISLWIAGVFGLALVSAGIWSQIPALVLSGGLVWPMAATLISPLVRQEDSTWITGTAIRIAVVAAGHVVITIAVVAAGRIDPLAFTWVDSGMVWLAYVSVLVLANQMSEVLCGKPRREMAS